APTGKGWARGRGGAWEACLRWGQGGRGVSVGSGNDLSQDQEEPALALTPFVSTRHRLNPALLWHERVDSCHGAVGASPAGPTHCPAFTSHRQPAPRVRRRKCQPATPPGETMPFPPPPQNAWHCGTVAM